MARAGARAVRVHPGSHEAHSLRFDGLIVGGGANVDPVLFGQSRLSDYGRYDEPRDKLELRLIMTAEERRIPIFAICRGMQLLNVSRGGTLKQDAWNGVAGDTRDSIRARFSVRITEGSRLAKAASGAAQMWTNRLHRQSVDEVGEGLRVSAVGQGGVVQAIEGQDETAFTLGVQWHPEYLPHRTLHQQLFRSFVRRAARNASGR